MERAVLCFCFLSVVGVSAQVTPAPVVVCTAGKYGANCELTCSEHCKTTSCDKTSGACSGGCDAGWKPSDPKCNTPCDNGRYGQDCSQTCSAHCSSSPCNKVNGACTCETGYQSPLCVKPCADGTYGQNCVSTCGQCQGGGSACNKVTGQCANGCSPGYRGSTCRAKCSEGYYGKDCASACGQCQGGSPCDHVTGVCPNDCASGFKPSMCQEECSAGGWGENCQNVCSENCQDPSTCNKKTGQCACKPGYQPPICTAQCASGRYGQDCNGRCGECLRRDSDCDHVTGDCTQCKDNREMPLCQDCIPGKFGSTCSQDCGQCGADGRCHRRSGQCLSSLCLPGWRSPTCDEKCPAGSYGQDCTYKCGHCRNGTPCRHDNGVCEFDCEDGYEGVLCQREKVNLVGPVVGAVLGAGVLIAIAIVVSVWFVKRHSMFKPVSQSKEDITTMAEIATVEADDAQTAPATPQTSEVYQNMQVNHSNEQPFLNPASTYDRMDMSRKAEDVHHYEVHSALKPGPKGPQYQQDDPLYQNASDVMASSTKVKAPAAPPEEPEATYGNL